MIESPDDYDDEITVDGEKVAFGIEEEEVIQYVAKCTYNGKVLESVLHDTETEAKRDLEISIRLERQSMRQVELDKLARWNAGKPR